MKELSFLSMSSVFHERASYNVKKLCILPESFHCQQPLGCTSITAPVVVLRSTATGLHYLIHAGTQLIGSEHRGLLVSL